MSWSRTQEQCINCKTSLFPHKGNGHCRKCYYVKQRIRKLETLSKEEFEPYMFDPLHNSLWQETKEKSQKEIFEIIAPLKEQKELKYLFLYGMIENKTGKIYVDKLEMIMNEIARRVRKSSTFYKLDLMCFDTRFTNEQRKILALKLLKILIK